MNEIIQKQLYNHYKIWNSIRKEDKKDTRKFNGSRPAGVGNEMIKCNKCREYNYKIVMHKRIYKNNKTIWYCEGCI